MAVIKKYIYKLNFYVQFSQYVSTCAENTMHSLLDLLFIEK
jgi:hypothetical protein